MFRFYLFVMVVLSAVIFLIMAIIAPPLRSSASLGRLVFADYPELNEKFVYLFDFEHGTRSTLRPLPYQDVGFLYAIDEQHIYASLCFGYATDDYSTTCSSPVTGVFAPEAVHKFDAVSQFWNHSYTFPVWSPDGRYIAYEARNEARLDTSLDIYVMNADGSHIVNVAPGPYDNLLYFSWSPDSQRLAFDCDIQRSLCVVDVDGSHMQKLYQATDTYVSDVAWSPDGSQIVFSLTANDSGNGALYLVNADGSNLHKLLEGRVSHYDRSIWSPDGSKIVFRSLGTDRLDMYVIKRDGTGLLNLSERLDGDVHGAVWSLDSMNVAFFSWQEQPNISIYLADASRGNPQKINRNLLLKDDGFPAKVYWIP
jgi:WD40 repeat protein